MEDKFQTLQAANAEAAAAEVPDADGDGKALTKKQKAALQRQAEQVGPFVVMLPGWTLALSAAFSSSVSSRRWRLQAQQQAEQASPKCRLTDRGRNV